MTLPESNLFTPHSLNGLNLRNRIVRSATLEGLGTDDGAPSAALIDLYRQLAAGGCGLLISGVVPVSADGKLLANDLAITSDEHIGGIKKLADAVHAEGGSFCLQIGHTGGQGNAKVCGGQTLAPSAIETAQYPVLPQAMTSADIERLTAAYIDAAARARQAGCDAVQIHAAHGYLLNQFLSPLTNHRDDEYGGSIENRSRLLLAIVAGIRERCGADFPVLVKLSGSDNLDGGLQLDEALVVARALDAAGITAIEISSGTPASGERMPIRLNHPSGDEMAYNVVLSRTIRQQVSCPIIVVGGIRSLHVASGILKTGQTDYVSMSRPLIREPDLPNKLQSGASEKSTCISCNGCLKAMLKGGIRCVIPMAKDD